MSDYDFRKLNDKEFEVMCADLLGAAEGVRYERFKAGRDAGVDGRFFMPKGGEAILQCKHWVSTPLEKLVSHLRSVERPKLVKLNPARYLLAVSHPLSRSDKKEIAAIIDPYIRSPSDIFGKEDLNDLLARHADVERRHYKLWISSSTVLQHLLNKPIYDRSAFTLDEIGASVHLYVPTSNHSQALKKLESLGCAIITGPPGIGKTTLAEHLAVHYVTKGFQFFRVAEEIREAEAVYDSSQRQVFYFDDFLGRNYLEALSGHEGSHIVQFIKRVSKDRKKRFILTSRSTILNQGKLLNDIFYNNNLDRNEFEITLGSFADIDRAQMLYNHMWHSGLSKEFVDELYLEKRYRKIIAHKNFNPRLIRYITEAERLSDCLPAQYWSYISEMLENPARVWENPFEAQQDDFGRALVLLVTLNGRAIEQNALAECYYRFIALPESATMSGRRDFLSNMKHLSGSLLSREISNQTDARAFINLFNPSIGDYVLRRYAKDVPSLNAGFASLRSTSSLRTLSNLSSNGLIGTDVAIRIVRGLLTNAISLKFIGYDVEYVASLGLMLHGFDEQLHPDDVWISKAIQFVLDSECPFLFGDAAEFIDWALSCESISQVDARNFLAKACGQRPNSSEIEQLGSIYSKLSASEQDFVTPMFAGAVTECLVESIYDEFPEDEVFKRVGPGQYSDAKRNLRDLVHDRLDDIGLKCDLDLIEQIVDSYDIHERHNDYFGSSEQDNEPQRLIVGAVPFDEIDDLFDRS